MGKRARGVSKFALVVSAIRCNCAVLGGGRLELTDFGAAQVQSRQVDQGTQAGKVCTEKGESVGAGVRYSNICIVGHQMQLQSFSGPTTDDVPVRALQPSKYKFLSLVQLASGSNEPGEGEISGSVRQCNFRWWPRRSGLQVGDFETRGACTNLQYYSTPPS